MNTTHQYSFATEENLSEEERIEALAWRIYDVIFSNKKAAKRPKPKKSHSRSFSDTESSYKVEDLFDILHLEA